MKCNSPLLCETTNNLEVLFSFKACTINDNGNVLTYQHGKDPVWKQPVNIYNEFINQDNCVYSTKYMNTKMGWYDFIIDQEKVVSSNDFVISSDGHQMHNFTFQRSKPGDMFASKIGCIDFRGISQENISNINDDLMNNMSGESYAKIFAEMDLVNEKEIGNLIFFVLSKEGYSSSAKILELSGESVSVNIYGDLQILPTWDSIGESGTRQLIFESDLSDNNIIPASIHVKARDVTDMIRDYSIIKTCVTDNEDENIWSYLSFNVLQGSTHPVEILTVGGSTPDTLGVTIAGTCMVDKLQFPDGTSICSFNDLHANRSNGNSTLQKINRKFHPFSLLGGSWGSKSILFSTKIWEKSLKGWKSHPLAIKFESKCAINEFTFWLQENNQPDDVFDLVTLKIYGSNDATNTNNGSWADLNVDAMTWIHESISCKLIKKNHKYNQGWVFQARSNINNYLMYKFQCTDPGITNYIHGITFDYKNIYEFDYDY